MGTRYSRIYQTQAIAMRIDSFISQNSDFSRKDIQRLIKQGRVTLNGSLVKKGQSPCTNSDSVMVDEVIISLVQPRYFMLHKPQGYVCANTDADHPTVLDLLDEPRKNLLQIAGRLDIDTTGLVLITDNGDWNHRVTSPKKQCEKCYRVETADPILEEAIEVFSKGIMLHSEDKPTLPARLIIRNTRCADLYISEGRYHQVKRMFAAIGNRVTKLHRHQIGSITLDANLNEGEYRPLTSSEVLSFV